jgi:DNA gyrase/topoisomerase IV subunit A
MSLEIHEDGLPEVRDGLPIVHRRMLLAMKTAGLVPGGPASQSFAIVRDVQSPFQPRGKGSTHDAPIAMARDFIARYPLIEGRDKLGSVEGVLLSSNT